MKFLPFCLIVVLLVDVCSSGRTIKDLLERNRKRRAVAEYDGIGCYKDTSDRAIPTIEGQDPILDGVYTGRENAIEKCAIAAQRKGFHMFAVQNGGWCAASATAEMTFDKYGKSTDCNNDGEGGPWANNIYVLKAYKSVGCYSDTANRAIPTIEGQDSTLDGSYPDRKKAIAKCAVAARKRGFKMFALQNGGWCATSATAEQTYNKYGKSTACNADGEGGPWANHVYTFEVTESCPKGYYGSPCQECPLNTYKDFVGHATACTSCPTNSGHPITGSVSIQDCSCFTGYAGAPQIGIPCTIRRCESLPVPANGLFVGQCSNEYLSVCGMACTDGYEALGSKERTCQVTANDFMEWSGTPLSCVVIRCPPLSVAYADPPTGVCTSPDLIVSTRCIFTCMMGYQLEGDKDRVCQLDKTWSGQSTTCVQSVIRCPYLSVVNADPPTGVCTSPSGAPVADLTYNTRCTFTCRTGYELKGDKERVCQLDETWSGQSTTCVVVRCPSLIVAYADPPTGVCTSPNLIVSTRCTFTCMMGYELVGDKDRVCQLDKSWSGQSTTCVQSG
ncbi:E-selectin-like isoform X3 [Oculina patagonica]